MIDDTEHIYTFVGEGYLALRGLREGAIESSTEVVRVKDEEIFVNEKRLLLRTNFDCNDGLETTSVWLSVMHNPKGTAREERTVEEPSKG